jgi:uncharacterized repeat protein (TIGR03843 family)
MAAIFHFQAMNPTQFNKSGGLTEQQILTAFSHGDFEIEGEFLWGSNYTFLARVKAENELVTAVYKPTRGQQPLWDFEVASLAKRETAAFIVSQMLGWKFVPATVFRKVGPLGAGSLQLFIEHDPEYHFFNFNPRDRQRLRPVVVFDLLVNNADRKGSHLLKDPGGKIWLIDHGLCFHTEPKLRTVIWEFIDDRIPEELRNDLFRFSLLLKESAGHNGGYYKQLSQLLTAAELRALARRAEELSRLERFPAPDPDRRPFPWPHI